MHISLALIWYHSCMQRECISSEHFSEWCLSRTRTVYLLILMQLILISWKLYSILSVRKMASTAEDWHQLYMCKRGKIRIMALPPTSQYVVIFVKATTQRRPPPLDLCSFGLDMKGGILVLAISHAPTGPDALIDAIICGCVAQGSTT